MKHLCLLPLLLLPLSSCTQGERPLRHASPEQIKAKDVKKVKAKYIEVGSSEQELDFEWAHNPSDTP